MMKLFLVAAFVAIAAADVGNIYGSNRPLVRPYRRSAPYYPLQPQPGAEIPILKSESNINPDGSYEYGYETANGIAAQEQGYQKSVGPDSGTVAQGSYQYTSPEGVPVLVQYVADENGFQPQSDILPTPPPIPDAILRALEWNAAHPEPQQNIRKLIFN